MIFSEEFMKKLGPASLRFSFVEVVHVELESKNEYLSNKRGNVRMLEVMRQEGFGKARFILDYEGGSLLIPTYDAPILLLLQHIPCFFYKVWN